MTEHTYGYPTDGSITGHALPGAVGPFSAGEVVRSPEVTITVGIGDLVTFAQSSGIGEDVAYGSWQALRAFWNGIPRREEYLRRSEQQPDLAHAFVTELFRAQSELPLNFEFGEDTEIYSGQLDAVSLYRTMEIMLQPMRSTLIDDLDPLKRRFLVSFLNSSLDPVTYPPLKYINPRRRRK